MYPLLIAGGLGLSLLLSLILIPEEAHPILGSFLAILAFVPTFALLRHRASNMVAPFFEKAQRLAQAGDVEKAVEALQAALPYRNWVLLLEKQVNTQIGVLYYVAGKEKKAVEFLSNGYPKISDGHLILGAVLYREKKLDEARKALELGIKFNRKSPILYNLLAWILNKEGQREAAIEVLQGGLKAMKSDEETRANLERLQNKQRMDMSAFGQLWYMLKFEMPKGMGPAPVRKGFRQPPRPPKRAR